MVNIFDTDKCIFICYPQGASGKFLINCLSITNYFYLQIPFYSYNKLKQNPNFAENYCIDKLKKFLNTKNQKWNDLDMGDIQFFGAATYLDKQVNKQKYNDIQNYKKILEQNLYFYLSEKKYFFRTIHSLEEFNYYKNIWKNPIIINFINCKNWISSRRVNKLENWEIIDNINVPYFSVTFNTDSLFLQETFFSEFKKLLDYFQLPLKNFSKIQEFYNLYSKYIQNI